MTTAVAQTAEQLVAEANEALSKHFGQKVTMLIENSMGCIVARHITLDARTHLAEKESAWAKKPLVFNLCYSLKGCRKVNGYAIAQENPVILAKGWQVIEGMAEVKKGQFMYDAWESCEFMYDAWESCDRDQFEAAKSSLTDIVFCYGD
jgi:hypothetical protein